MLHCILACIVFIEGSPSFLSLSFYIYVPFSLDAFKIFHLWLAFYLFHYNVASCGFMFLLFRICKSSICEFIFFIKLRNFRPFFLKCSLWFPSLFSFWDSNYTHVKLSGVFHNSLKLCTFYLSGLNFGSFLRLYMQTHWSLFWRADNWIYLVKKLLRRKVTWRRHFCKWLM